MQTKINKATKPKKGATTLVKVIVLCCLCAISFASYATHNRAGEIIFRRISGFTYEATIITYTKISAPVDRSALLLDWGDNTRLDTLSRTSIDETTFSNRDVRISKYVGRHTFAGPGKFTIAVEDPNRNNNILNLKPPNGQSDQVVFYIESVLIINPFAPANIGAHNNSAILLNPPIDQACLGQPYEHNPGAYDPDGDSLVYKLVPNRVEGGAIPPYYVSPDKISPGPDNQISINPFTGDVLWDSPQQAGQYNIAILIEEYRGGLLVGSVLRDMQITVETCDNIAPKLSIATQDTCVIAGESIQVFVSATDPNNDPISLSATGQPFQIANPASFGQVPNTNDGSFFWNTNCDHVRERPYQVVVRAEDQNSSVQLVDYSSFFVRVIAPAPKNIFITAGSNQFTLNWDTYNNTCTDAKAIKIYRREGNTQYQRPYCQTGMPVELGYTLISTTSDASVTSFTDTDVNLETEYCYRLVACFNDGSESVVSEEVCSDIRLDVPIMRNVSVGFTNNTTGRDTIRWRNPVEIDSVTAFPGPYSYRIYRGIGFSATNLIATIPASATLAGSVNEFIDVNINTQDTLLSYRVELLSGGDLVGSSGTSSSILLKVLPGDNKNKLVWTEKVNWGNFQYQIERFNNGTLLWDSIGSTFFGEFVDDNVFNDTEYCYRIISFGKYKNELFNPPFINYSQEKCGTPFDNIPPCPPTLVASPDCENEEVILSWEDGPLSCSNDITGYRLYYKETINGDYSLIGEFAPTDKSGGFTGDNNIAGCFYITAFDENGNESEASNIECSENCPAYQLPDVITPNGDGVNDIFKPFSRKFVRNAEIKIFNRWGNIVFETTDPDIGWNGNFRNTSQLVSEGAYFYVISYEVSSLEGIREESISGYITLLR